MIVGPSQSVSFNSGSNKKSKKTAKNKLKKKLSSSGISPKSQSQNRKRKHVQDSLNLDNNQKNKAPKLKNNINQDQTVKLKKDRSWTKSNRKSQKWKCIMYLKKWKTDQSNWEYAQSQQLQLFSLIFDKKKMPKESYEIFLVYMEKMSNKDKHILKNQANRIVSAVDKWEGKSEEEKSTSTAPYKNECERARSILQKLKQS